MMLVEIKLNPAGVEAESVMSAWLEARCLKMNEDGLVGINPGNCLEDLFDLKDRCYDHVLTINASFAGERR